MEILHEPPLTRAGWDPQASNLVGGTGGARDWLKLASTGTFKACFASCLGFVDRPSGSLGSRIGAAKGSSLQSLKLCNSRSAEAFSSHSARHDSYGTSSMSLVKFARIGS
jgi:hypothetical protein